MKIDPLFVSPHQARKKEPSAYELQLGDAIEQAFGQGLWELDQLVDHLNKQAVYAPDGQAWTAQRFQAEIKQLAV
jgi:hypothetical protein